MNAQTITSYKNDILAYHQDKLSCDGYTIIYENEFNINPDQKINFVQSYYNDLESDISEVHANRMRAREVFNYTRDTTINLERSKDTAIVNKNYEGSRDYKRIELTNNHLCMTLANLFITLIPKTLRKPCGELGVNLFRTYDVVTQTRHQDFVDFVLIYCLNLQGQGAITELTRDKQGLEVVVKTELMPGQLLIFEDSKFFHYTTPLKPLNNQSLRDVMIMTIGV